jgi:hypothetical protein
VLSLFAVVTANHDLAQWMFVIAAFICAVLIVVGFVLRTPLAYLYAVILFFISLGLLFGIT